MGGRTAISLPKIPSPAPNHKKPWSSWRTTEKNTKFYGAKSCRNYTYYCSLFNIRPVLSSRKALRLAARSLHQCCRAQCCRANNHALHSENMILCLQDTLVHGIAVGTATPKHPNIRYSQIYSGKSVIIAVGRTYNKAIADLLPAPTQEVNGLFVNNVHRCVSVTSRLLGQNRVPKGLKHVVVQGYVVVAKSFSCGQTLWQRGRGTHASVSSVPLQCMFGKQ